MGAIVQRHVFHDGGPAVFVAEGPPSDPLRNFPFLHGRRVRGRAFLPRFRRRFRRLLFDCVLPIGFRHDVALGVRRAQGKVPQLVAFCLSCAEIVIGPADGQRHRNRVAGDRAPPLRVARSLVAFARRLLAFAPRFSSDTRRPFARRRIVSARRLIALARRVSVAFALQARVSIPSHSSVCFARNPVARACSLSLAVVSLA